MADRLPHANWNLLPEHIRDGVRLYIEHGVPPGGFLTAVISNDLKNALGRADDIHRPRLHDIVRFFYCDAPAGCWGSPEALDEWIDAGGLIGIEDRAEADWQHRQDALMESGSPDDSAYRRDMIAAGRGHLIR